MTFTFIRKLLVLPVFWAADASVPAISADGSKTSLRGGVRATSTSASASAHPHDMLAKQPPVNLKVATLVRFTGAPSTHMVKTDAEDAIISPTTSMLKVVANQSNYDLEEAEAYAIDANLDLGERLIIDAWDIVRKASVPRSFQINEPTLSLVDKFRKLVASVGLLEWYLFGVAIAVVICMDLLILQQLPEAKQANFGLLILWLFIATFYCVGVGVRFGLKSCISWASGYLLELIFSMRNLFVFNLIIQTLETPRRLIQKTFFLVLIGSIATRFMFHLGLAEVVCKISFLPYIIGGWLVYCGTSQMSRGSGQEWYVSDVTRVPIIRFLRKCLGDRLGEYYDEDGEALFLVSRHKVRMTLLGVVVICLLITDLLFSADVTVVKLRVIPNPYVSFSSSVLALITLRAVFFVVRDILRHMSLARYGTGMILLFVGAETVAARFLEISALMSLIVVVNILVSLAFVSALRDTACTKRVG